MRSPSGAVLGEVATFVRAVMPPQTTQSGGLAETINEGS